MNRRAFLATTAAGAAVAAFPAILKAQGGDTIKVGFPGPTTGPFGALAKDQQQGASVAMEEINAKGGILGRRLEILFRDDQLKPAVGAQRTKELIENERCEFIVGGLAAHVQMAINEQTKKAGKLIISVSQSDEITARPDWGPLTFHEALNPDRKSTRLNSSHGYISYAVFCLKKKNKQRRSTNTSIEKTHM